MEGIANIDISSWSGNRILNLFIAWPHFTAIECLLGRFLHHDFILEIVLLFLRLVSPWAWILYVRLLCVGGLDFVTPKVCSFSFGKERGGVLAYHLTVHCSLESLLCFLFDRLHGLVRAWAGVRGLDLLVLAIWDGRLEHFILSGGIPILFVDNLIIVDSWTGVILPCHVIVLHIVLLKQFSLDFALGEIVLLLGLWLLRIVSGWPHRVEASPRV